MFVNRNQFYKSKRWESFISGLRLERINGNGELLCAACGKPIIKKYDCIGHHKIELTDKNVNDFNISLNPDNVELVHFKCHNNRHHRFGFEEQKVYCVYGSPCAGKTTWVKENAGKDDIVLDIDSIYEMISVNDRYIKSNRIATNVFGIRDCIIEMIKMRRGKWINAFIIGGYPLIMDRERLYNQVKCEFIFIDSEKEICLERAKNRSDDWIGFVNEWFEKYQPSPHLIKNWNWKGDCKG